jgi:hypothetical protein
MGQGWTIDVDPGHPARDLRQQCRSVSFATGNIENIFAMTQVTRKEIPVKVLNFDLAMGSRCPPFTGEF